MKIHDISQEVYSCYVIPGDPEPKRELLCHMDDGSPFTMTAFSMCAHNGTHVDAPSHFCPGGKTLSEIALEKFVGWCFVAPHEGTISADDMAAIIADARAAGPEYAQRILIKGDATLTVGAAQQLACAGVQLYGNESATVGSDGTQQAVHQALLGSEIAILEGIRLGDVPCGCYLLSAAPLHLGGGDGAPCRAVLIEI